MHVEVYEKVPRAIKFTGSVLHRVARVAFSFSPLSLLPLYAGYGGVETREARRIQ